MATYEIFKKQVFMTSRIVKADSNEEAIDKFDVISENIDPAFEDENPRDEIVVRELNDCDECDVDY